MSWVGRLCAVATLGLTGVGLVFVTLTTFPSSVVQAFAGAGWLLAGCMAVRYLWDGADAEAEMNDRWELVLRRVLPPAFARAKAEGRAEGYAAAWHDLRGGVP